MTEAVSITDSGIVGGDFVDSTGVLPVFRRELDGSINVIPMIHGAGAMNGGSLNNTGLMSGNYAADPFGSTGAFGFTLQGSTLTAPIIYTGALITQLGASNDAGYIAGYHLPGFGALPQSFVRAPDGTLTDFFFPGAIGTQLYDINNHGHLSGGYVDTAGVMHGFIYRDGQFLTVDYTGPNTIVFGLNDRGQAVGASFETGNFFSGPYDGFVASTVPEPAVFPVLGGSLLGVGLIARRRRR